MVMKRPMVAFLTQLLLTIRSRFTRRARLEAGEREEDLDVQAFIAQPSVKRLDVTVLHRFARTNEVQLQAELIRPPVHRSGWSLTCTSSVRRR